MTKKDKRFGDTKRTNGKEVKTSKPGKNQETLVRKPAFWFDEVNRMKILRKDLET